MYAYKYVYGMYITIEIAELEQLLLLLLLFSCLPNSNDDGDDGDDGDDDDNHVQNVPWCYDILRYGDDNDSSS